MQTGLVTSESVSQILRGISQRRQSGSLDILTGARRVTIIFANGKIVDAFDENQPSLARLWDFLKDRDLIRTDLPFEPQNLSDLLRCFHEDPEVDNEAIFKTAIKSDLLNLLYDVDLADNAVCEFIPYIHDYDRDFMPGISVSQYLLDRASLESESKRFNTHFPDGSIIIKLELAGLALSTEEMILYDAIVDRSEVSEIFSRSLLSRYQIVTTLLSFYERAIIEIESGTSVLTEAAAGKIVDVLKVSSERPFIEQELNLKKEGKEKKRKEPAPQDDVTVETKPNVAKKKVAEAKKVKAAAPHSAKKPLNILKISQIYQAIKNFIPVVFLAAAAFLIASRWSVFLSGF